MRLIERAYVRAAAPCVIFQALLMCPATAQDVAPTHDATTGTMAGQAGTEGGAATYTVPIVVPPGRAGMQPSLAITYNSRSGDGLMGVGWTLSGVSAIHRCPQTPEQDDPTLATYSPGVRYNNNDRLCLDGQRLVKVNAGAYGANSSEYRTEIDTYARIYQTGGDLTGSATCFRVEQKDGRVAYFGAITNGSPQQGIVPTACSTSVPNARVLPAGAAGTLSWMVVRIEDRVGNNEDFAYSAFGSGEVLLSKVTYTGFQSTPGDRVVTFNYQNRTSASSTVTDYASSYLAGGLTLQTQALKCITTAAGSVTSSDPCDTTKFVRTYTPTYATAGHAGDTGGFAGRLLMTNLQECATNAAGAASCHPATHFLYNDSALDYPLTSLTGLGLPGNTSSSNPYTFTTLVDLDGDGTREMVAYTDTTNKWLVQLTGDRSLHSSLNLSGTTFCVLQSCYADIDSSGRAAQVLTPQSSGVAQVVSFAAWNYALFPRGTPATSNPFFTIASNIPYTYGVSQDFRAADFNGDGKTDIAIIGPDATTCGTDALGAKRGIFIWLNAMTSALQANGATPQFLSVRETASHTPLAVVCLPRTISGSAYTEPTFEHIGDVDGNGLPDIYLVNSPSSLNAGDFAGVAFVQRSGTTITAAITSCSGLGLTDATGSTDECHWSRNYVTHWMDVNGDGLEDFVLANPTSPGWRMKLNKGGSFTPVSLTGATTAGQPVYIAGTKSYFRYATRLPVMDVDSDGKPDILVPSTTQGMQGFALKMCKMTKVDPVGTEGCPVGFPAGGSPPHALDVATCPAYSCPEDPDGINANLPLNGANQPGYHWEWHNLPAFGTYQGADVHGLPVDASSYYLAMLKFVQTSATAFRIDLVETPLVSRLGDEHGHTDDLFGDGLMDIVSTVGCANHVISNPPPNEWSFPECSAMDDGVYGPATFPDGTATTGFATNWVLYGSINQGVPGFGGSPNAPAFEFPHLAEPQVASSSTAILLPPILPGLLDGAFNGLGDFTSWGYLPLSVPSLTDGKAMYTIDNSYLDDRHYYFQSSMPVVWGMAQSNGNGNGTQIEDVYGFRSAHYRYGDAIYNHFGRGFQGFRSIAVQTVATDADQQTETTTVYHQKFPLAGKIDTVTSLAPDTGNWILFETDRWICGTTNRSACPEGTTTPTAMGGKVYTPLLDQRSTSRFDVNWATALSHTKEINAAIATGGPSGWDQYGNLKFASVTVGDDTSGVMNYLTSLTTTTTRSFTYNSTIWHVDQPDDQSVTSSIAYSQIHTLPGGATTPDRTVHTTYTWNPDRTPWTQTVQPGVADQERITTYQYPTPTSYGLPSKITVMASSATPTTRDTSMTYTKDGTTTAADGYFVLTQNNPLSQGTTMLRSKRDGQVTTLTDVNGLKTVNTYDAFGRLMQSDFTTASGATLYPSRYTSLSRCSDIATSDCPATGSDSFGEDNNQPFVSYRSVSTQSGYPTTVDWFDALGRQIKHSTRGFNGTFIANITSYDEMNRVAATSAPYTVGSAIPSDGLTTSEYDRLGRVTSKLAPGDALDATHGDIVTTYSYAGTETDIHVHAETVSTCGLTTNLCMNMKRFYDAAGDLVKTTQSLNGTSDYAVVKFWYDSAHNPVAVQDAESNLIKATYNDIGQRKSVVDPDAGTTFFSYDALGNVLTSTDARNIQVTSTYDALDRPLTRTAKNNPTPVPAVIQDNYTYDPANGIGKLNYAQRLTGATVGSVGMVWQETNSYNPSTKRLATQTTHLDGQGSDWVTGYSFDSSGRLASISYPNPTGFKVGRGYTTFGYLNEFNSTTGTVYWHGTTADAWGRIVLESYGGGGINGSHQTDPNTGQPLNLHWSTSAGVVDDWVYQYDSFANLTAQTRTAPGMSSTETLSYDPLQRLSSAQTCPSGTCATTTYAYSASGNILTKSDYSDSSGYQYNGNGCGPHGVKSVTFNSVVTTYACDFSGNVVGGSTLTAAYDFANLPWSITRAGAGAALFTYDANNHRFREQATSLTTWYGPEGFERTNTSSGTVDRVEVGPIALVANGGATSVYAELKDRLGSTVYVKDTNLSGLRVPSLRAYDGFGKARNKDFSTRPNGTLDLDPTTLRGFTGHEHVDDVWLVHMNGRVYDYQLGRFLSVDPSIDNPMSSQGLNPYSYIGNNPLSGTDPTGYDCQADTKGDVESTCLLSNGGVNKVTDASGKTLATVVALDKGDTVSANLNNGGSFGATFTGHTGDISRLLSGSAPDIGSIGRMTNGAFDGIAGSYALGQDRQAAQVVDVMAQQQEAQRNGEFEAYRRYTFAHEGLVEPLDEALKLHPLIGGANTVAACLTGSCSPTDVAFGAAAMLPGGKILGGAAKELSTLRRAYVSEVQALEDVGLNSLVAGSSKEATARMLHQMRRDLGEQYKNRTPPGKLEEIYSRNLQKYGDKLGPSVDWLRAHGKSWDQIIESASRAGGQDLGF